MYRLIEMSEFDQHVHRFLWRDMDTFREFDHFMLNKVTFGDCPSGAIATIALRYTAEMNRESFPHVAKLIEENTYMNDMIKSVDTLSEAFTLITDTETVLREGNFHIKYWMVSSEGSHLEDINILDVNNAKVLGLQWLPSRDDYVFSHCQFFKKTQRSAALYRND